MERWDQIYCDIHGRQSLLWVETATSAGQTFTVLCTGCSDKRVAQADARMAEEFGRHVPGMNIRSGHTASEINLLLHGAEVA